MLSHFGKSIVLGGAAAGGDDSILGFAILVRCIRGIAFFQFSPNFWSLR
jgi:hypothetical protein